MKRINWDKYFLDIAQLVSSRSTCIRRKVGAVIIKDHRILSTGYNGAPKKFKHCTSETCIRYQLTIPNGERHELCRGIHAEQNAIIQAAKYGIKIDNAVLYITDKPCSICIKMLINLGIRKIYYLFEYPDKLRDDLLVKSKIEIVKYEK